MLDVFHEEVRSHALAMQQGVLAQLMSPGEAAQLRRAHRRSPFDSRGAARLIDHGLAAQLAETLEAYFARARSGSAILGAAEGRPLAAALEIFVDLIGQTSEASSEGSARRAADMRTIAERLSSTTTPAPQEPSKIPALEAHLYKKSRPKPQRKFSPRSRRRGRKWRSSLRRRRLLRPRLPPPWCASRPRA